MQISLNWLKDYINLDGLSVDQISAALTDIGLEVEAVAKSAAFGDTVVVGRIISAEKHPNADSLRVCKVDVGKPEALQIVCGAPNARAGIDACVALVGTSLPGDLKIKEAKIRGEESFGMMCSAKELALSDGHEGIIELATGFKPGTPVIKALGLDDVILTLNVTPNRADCLGHIGVARDLGARLGKALQMPDFLPKTSALSSKDIKVDIQTDRCGRFTALAIKNVRAVSSPGWLKQRLEAVGMRSINLLVDVTNYVMLEMNHPVHAYDDRDVKGRSYSIREAIEGETFRTLDNIERLLKGNDTLICDGERPIGLAGIMGGMNSEIKADTTNIILEVACFDPISVRTTARRLGIHSEASHRFERGVDMNRTERVARRFGALLQACVAELNAAGAGLPMPEIAGDVVDVCPFATPPRLIALRCNEARRLLACPIVTNDQIKKIFEGLEFRLVDQNQDRLVFEIPTWRMDCERECDLVEEVGRLLGYDKVPYQLPSMTIEPTAEDSLVGLIEDARTDMASRGLRETISLPFWSDEDAEKMRLPSDHPFSPSLKIANPIAEDSRWLHTTLACGLIKAVQNNRRHGVKGARLFELGRGYYDFNAKPVQRSTYSLFKNIDRKGRHLSTRAREEKSRPTERHWISGIIDQPWTPKSWDTTETATTFFHVKAVVLSWLKGFGINEVQVHRIEKDNVPFLHPGSSAYLFSKGQVIGWLGELHPEVAIAYDLEPTQTPMLFELDLEAVLDMSSKRPKFSTESFKFPANTRDLALLVDSDLTHDAMAAAIVQFPQKRHLREWHIFDIFQGANIPAGKKSVAWSFSFQSAEKTLSDQDVDGEFKNLTGYLTTKFKAEQR
jgi:phenylalanyl-tRNA synthetase beta chain